MVSSAVLPRALVTVAIAASSSATRCANGREPVAKCREIGPLPPFREISPSQPPSEVPCFSLFRAISPLAFESRPPRYCRQVARRLAAYVRELASPDTASALASDSLRSSGSADFVQELSESRPPR